MSLRRTLMALIGTLCLAASVATPSASAASVTRTWIVTATGGDAFGNTVYGVAVAEGIVNGGQIVTVLSCNAVTTSGLRPAVGCYLWGNIDGQAYYGTVYTDQPGVVVATYTGVAVPPSWQTYRLCVHVGFAPRANGWLRNGCANGTLSV